MLLYGKQIKEKFRINESKPNKYNFPQILVFYHRRTILRINLSALCYGAQLPSQQTGCDSFIPCCTRLVLHVQQSNYKQHLTSDVSTKHYRLDHLLTFLQSVFLKFSNRPFKIVEIKECSRLNFEILITQKKFLDNKDCCSPRKCKAALCRSNRYRDMTYSKPLC